MPTIEQLKQLNPQLDEAQIRSMAEQDGITLDAPAAPAPSMLDKFKGLVTSGPAMKTAGTMLGEVGAGLLAPETGGASFLIPPALAALGSVAGGAISRGIHGEAGTAQDAAGDALEGVGGHYMGPALSALGKGAAYVRDVVPRAMRLGGYGIGQLMHPSVGHAVGELAAERGPEAAQAGGDMITRGRNWLQGLLKPAEESGRPMVDTSVPPKTPFKRNPMNEQPYRMGGAPTTPGEPNIMSETRNAAQPPSSFEALMKSSSPASGNPTGAANDMLTNQRGIDWMHKEFDANNGIFGKMAEKGQFGDVPKGEALAKRGSFNSQTPELVEPGPSAVGQVEPGSSDVEAMLEKLGFGRESKPMLTSHAPTADAPIRPPGDFVHPADTSGGKFGFDELPEISESELSRLQRVMGRMGR